jgi:hypothetical protein
MFTITDFTGQIYLNAKIHNANPNRAAELNAIAAALNTDPSTHDTTITRAPTGLQPGQHGNTRFTNDVLLVVNAGKGGNLTPLAMSNAITAELSKIFPPVNTSAPAVTGTGAVGNTLTVTNGNWTYVPTSYAYRWQRNGTPIAGAGAANPTYVLAAADSGTNVACIVTATNAAGATPAVSNAIAVA